MSIQLQVNTAQRFQSIDHFGASGAWAMDPIGKQWTEESKEQLADLLFDREKGIGLTVWRFNIGSGAGGGSIPDAEHWRGYSDTFKASPDAPFNPHAHAGQRWFMKAARERGVEHFIAMSYSPPVWMTRNGKCAPDESCGQSNLPKAQIEAFAAYIADVLAHFQGDVTEPAFQTVSPVNEPSWSWDASLQEGNRSPNEQIKALVYALQEQLIRRNLNVEIDVAEAAEIATLLDDEDVQQFDPELPYYKGHDNTTRYGGKYREYIRDFLGDERFAAVIGNRLSYHSYWADHKRGSQDRLGDYRNRLRKTLTRYRPDAKLWQTEYCNLNADGPGRDLGMDTALFTARVIHHDLVIAEASSWQWWLAVSPHDYKDGLIYTDYQRPGDEQNILPSKTLWALGHYSRFVRPGAYRISISEETNGESLTNPEGLMLSAFAHDQDRTLSIIAVNYAERPETIVLASEDLHLPGGYTWSYYVTTAAQDDNLRYLPLTDPAAPIVVPGRSLVTLYGTRL